MYEYEHDSPCAHFVYFEFISINYFAEGGVPDAELQVYSAVLNTTTHYKMFGSLFEWSRLAPRQILVSMHTDPTYFDAIGV